MFPAMSLLQLREAAESVSASPASERSDSHSPPPAPPEAADSNGVPLSILPQLPLAPLPPAIDPFVPLCLSTAICFRAQSALSRPPPSRKEKARTTSPIFSPGMLRINVELRQQSQPLLSFVPSLPIFPTPQSGTTHVGSFGIVVHLDSNKVHSNAAHCPA